MSTESFMNKVRCPLCGEEENNGRCTFKFKMGEYEIYKCPACEVEFLHPFPTGEQLREYYAAQASDGCYQIEVQAGRNDAHKQIAGIMEKEYRRRVGQPRAGLKWLDIGCFCGTLLDEAKNRGWETWGVEPQPEAARLAESKHGTDRIFSEPLESFQCPANTFDVVSSIAVIEHLTRPKKLFEEAFRGLKPGGIFLMETPDVGSLMARAMGKYWFCYAVPEHTFYFNRRNLTSLLKEAGFIDVQYKYDIRWLRIGHVIYQMQFFGKDIHRRLKPIFSLIPEAVKKLKLPLYGGEVFAVAQKPASQTEGIAD